MRPFFAIVLKDLKLYAGNRRALLLTVVVPIAIASFFGSIFGGEGGKTKVAGVRLQVVDLDRSEISAEIVTNLQRDASLQVSLVGESEARTAIRNGRAVAAVIMPANFGATATAGFFGGAAKPVLTIFHDPSRNFEAGMVRGILIQHVMQAVGRKLFADANALPDANGPAGTGSVLPFTLADEQSTRPAGAGSDGRGYNGYAHSFGGMSMQFLLMAAIEWGLAILLERQRGLWRRLRSAPLSRGTLLAGRATSSSLIGMATLAVCWGFSMVVFHVRVSGSWPGFIACNVALAMFAASLGLFIAALGGTPEATRSMAIFAILILVMLGGAWVPSFLFPQWLQNVTLVIPARWAVDGFDAMTWRGLGWTAALGPVAVLLGSTVVCGLLAYRCFSWEAD